MHFSIASGGHATAYGASNLDAGITLDLGALNSVSLAADASYIDVGTGARWLDVYQVLDPFGLTVAGGRAASVGVGGYLLGGMCSLCLLARRNIDTAQRRHFSVLQFVWLGRR